MVDLSAFDVAATGGPWGARLCASAILAPQRVEVAGALRRRGGRDVDRPSRNDSSSNAGAVGISVSEPPGARGYR